MLTSSDGSRICRLGYVCGSQLQIIQPSNAGALLVGSLKIKYKFSLKHNKRTKERNVSDVHIRGGD